MRRTKGESGTGFPESDSRLELRFKEQEEGVQQEWGIM
jgi:hypothetical protein